MPCLHYEGYIDINIKDGTGILWNIFFLLLLKVLQYDNLLFLGFEDENRSGLSNSRRIYKTLL